MKILHTSDWHLGHTLYNYDRTAEQQSFLRQLTRIVTEEQPDAMVVSGDIYHYSSPAAATQKMYTDAMLNIHQACPGMAIVVTAGNHDSSSKLEIDSSLWQHFGLNVVGNIERTAEEVNLDKHITWRLSPRPHPMSTAEDFSACSSSAGIAPDEKVPASFDGRGRSNDSVSFGAIAL